MTQATLKAPDISCDHCIASIENAVTKLPGVRFVSGDLEGKRVIIDFDPKLVEIGAIEAAMEEEGYPVAR
jgi:copper ion binding protein